jgi:hypothetical protein
MKLSWTNPSTQNIEIVGANHALMVEKHGPTIHELAANRPASGA